MTIQITPSEWEALSAYLDNQLSDRERVQVETRLQSEPQMRQALDDLRRTRLILRSQPRLRAPRNFTLTSATAGTRSRRFWSLSGVASPFTTLRLASALATIFLILITVGDLAVRRFAPEPRTVAMSEQAPNPIMGMGGGGGGVAVPAIPAPTEVTALEAPAVAPEAQSALASEIPDQQPLVVTPLSSPDAAVEKAGKRPAEAREGPPVDTVNAVPGAGAAAKTTTNPVDGLIRALQALLLVLALGAGAGAWLMRRQAS